MKAITCNYLSFLLVIKGATASYSSHDDASWSIHSTQVSDRLNAERRPAYNDFMQQCREHNSASQKDVCGLEDAYRRYANVYQPGSLYNYTETGFMKTRIPQSLHQVLLQFWQDNENATIPNESSDHSYQNTWEAPRKMMNVADNRWNGGGVDLYSRIASTVQHAVQEWTGVPQAIASVYGIRKHTRNSVLAPHVDRMPLVSSAVLHLGHETEEDWPLEIYDHEGQAHNITLRPGEMLLYESASCVYGRPFPLKGDYSLDLFAHFEPLLPPPGSSQHQVREDNLPPYLIPGTPWAHKWEASHPQGWQLDALKLAQMGDTRTLRHLGQYDPERLQQTDAQGWQPLHEAARFGHLDLVQYLVLDAGISLHRQAVSPLAVAEQYLPAGHHVIDFLKDRVRYHGRAGGENRTTSRVRWV